MFLLTNNLASSRLQALHQAVSSLTGVTGETYSNNGHYATEEDDSKLEDKLDVDGTLTTK
ncbi:MAG: hypothetical protein WBV73_30910 [Phormidium sp.]